MIVFLWFGFVGAWLLFAGPVYQAAIELREEGFDEAEAEAWRARMGSLPPQPRISRWWWLLPPAAYVLNRRRSREWRMAAMRIMTAAERDRFRTFQNKAVGWLVVGFGALCIAVKESAELIEHYEWSWWALVPFLGIPFLASVGFTVSRMGRERELRELLASDPADAPLGEGD